MKIYLILFKQNVPDSCQAQGNCINLYRINSNCFVAEAD